LLASAKLLNDAHRIAENAFRKFIADEPGLRAGSFSSGIEEYLEAVFFRDFVLKRELPDLATLSPEPDVFEVVGALSDFTGELGRWCVNKAIAGDHDGVRSAVNIARDIEGWFRKTALPASLTKKKASVNQNVIKMEKVSADMDVLGKMTSVQQE